MFFATKLRRLFACYGLPRRRTCIYCGKRLRRFLPYRQGMSGRPVLMRSLDVVGSDLDNFSCPHCGAHDRERHLLMYLQASGVLVELRGEAILHFAPEPRLSGKLSAAAPSRYVKCDLHPSAHDVARVDITAIPFPDQSFDLVIANHVLEHVDDDLLALREISRVMKIGGWAILQTPYAAKLNKTWQDSGITGPVTRLQAHGQEDHVRLYGCDIFERFASTGLTAYVRQHDELLADADASMMGVNVREPFFLYRRKL